MAVLLYVQLLILAAFVVQRLQLLSIPAFVSWKINAPWENLICGLTSDLSLAFFFVAALELLKVPRGKAGKRLSLAAGAGIGAALLLSLAGHVKYVEYFGHTARPEHYLLLKVGAAWTLSFQIVMESARSLVCVALPCLIAGALWYAARRCFGPEETRIDRPRRLARLVVLAGLGSGLHFASLLEEYWIELKPDIRHNFLLSAYLNYKARTEQLHLPTEEERGRAVRFFSSVRQRNDEIYPLWQSSLPTGKATTPENEKTREVFRRFLADGTAKDGPWNVIMVMEESLRANEMEAFGPVSPSVRNLMPQMSRIFKEEGVRFTETIGSGEITSVGLLSTLCSLPLTSTSVLDEYPTANLVCLSDVFSARNYETFFLCGYWLTWSNAGQFFSYHQTDHLIGRSEYPADSPIAIGGITDRVLFRRALDELTQSPSGKPFFAVIQTQSFHMPFTLPPDAPPIIDRTTSLREQVRQYVDFSFGEFFEELRRRAPHTIVVVVADHGMHYEDEPAAQMNYEWVRTAYRIPFVIAVPSLSKEVAGRQVSTLASNGDVAPTLLSLLQWLDVPQAFLGYDAFARREPVFAPHYTISYPAPNQQPVVSSRNEVEENIIPSLIKFDQLAPAPSDRSLREQRIVRRGISAP